MSFSGFITGRGRTCALVPMLCMLSLPALLPAERIVFLGDSLTAGYGLDPEQAFPRVVGDLLEEKGHEVSIVNAGVSGDTTAGGLRRLGWILKQPMDILFVALGANDALRGQPVEATRENLRQIIQQARETHPKVEIILAGMLAPPNMGEEYRTAFSRIYPELAETESVKFLPFLLEGVAGNPSLNLADGIHPNAEGHNRIARLIVGKLDR